MKANRFVLLAATLLFAADLFAQGPPDADQAKDLVHALRGKPGALPVASLGDEAVQVVLQPSPERAKIEWIVARKGDTVIGVGDEEFVAQDPKMRLTKEEKTDKIRASLK